MNLDAYLARIGYGGSLEPTLATLRDLHRAHLLAIPYENLDIHLGRTLPLDEAHIFDKVVTQRRGGWCFEMNGLFAWALLEVTAAGMRERVLESADDFSAVLRERLGLELPETYDLWKRIWAGHLAWTKATSN